MHKHPLFILAVVAALVSLGFAKWLAISIVFGFALFLCFVPVAVGAVVVYHYACEAVRSGNWKP